jgi:hypothetical protein
MYFIILFTLSAIVIIVSTKTSMLRNELFNEENFCKIAKAQNIKVPRAAFSLGRSQLAFWTVIIVSSFIDIFLKCSTMRDFDIPVIDSVNLTLLGIAAGTTLVSKVIDNSQKDNQGEAISQQDYPSKDFLTDIISDEKGVSIHRLQNVIWTVVVGAIYIGFVAGHEQLPDEKIITTQLLSLMGISTGAYLGLKLNENKNAPVNDATTNVQPSIPPTPPPPPAQPTASLPTGGGSDNGGTTPSTPAQQETPTALPTPPAPQPPTPQLPPIANTDDASIPPAPPLPEAPPVSTPEGNNNEPTKP